MMKNILIIAALIYLAASQTVRQCPQGKRKVTCLNPEKYVCGIKYNGDQQVKQTYANRCIACVLGQSIFTINGICENFPSNAKFCSPEESNQQPCGRNDSPHCGWYNRSFECSTQPCTINEGSRCDACATQDVLYTTTNNCPTA